jgi:hypothetical protein
MYMKITVLRVSEYMRIFASHPGKPARRRISKQIYDPVGRNGDGYASPEFTLLAYEPLLMGVIMSNCFTNRCPQGRLCLVSYLAWILTLTS